MSTDDRPANPIDATDLHRRLQASPGLIAWWDFAHAHAGRYRSTLTDAVHQLQPIGGPVPRVDGPLGGAVRFDQGGYLRIPYEDTGRLNVCGPDAQLSIFAIVRLDDHEKRGGTVAGMWSEGLGQGDDSGVRQYALLLDMPWYGGLKQVTPHVSSEGGATRRADGSMLPWCADYAATAERYPVGRWTSMGMTYDGTWLTAYVDGVATPRPLDPVADKREDPYFTAEGPAGGDRGMNPYYHGRGIFDYAQHADAKPGGGSPFVVGARQVRGEHGAEPLAGALAGLAVFDACLTAETMAGLHQAAVA